MKNKKITQTAAAAALAIVLGYVETLVPLPFPIPGIKLGLSNLCVLFVLYRFGHKTAWTVMIFKVILSSLLISGFQTFWFSIAGGVFSVGAMTALKKVFSLYGVSILGGVMHNIGQLSAAAIVMKTPSVFLYLPPLLISGAVCGLLIGILCKMALEYIPK